MTLKKGRSLTPIGGLPVRKPNRLPPAIILAAAVLAVGTTTVCAQSDNDGANLIAQPGVQWQGLNLTQTNLYFVDLTGADLSNAILTNVVSQGVTLTSANLSSANLTGADFAIIYSTGANFTDAN